MSSKYATVSFRDRSREPKVSYAQAVLTDRFPVALTSIYALVQGVLAIACLAINSVLYVYAQSGTGLVYGVLSAVSLVAMALCAITLRNNYIYIYLEGLLIEELSFFSKFFVKTLKSKF